MNNHWHDFIWSSNLYIVLNIWVNRQKSGIDSFHHFLSLISHCIHRWCLALFILYYSNSKNGRLASSFYNSIDELHERIYKCLLTWNWTQQRGTTTNKVAAFLSFITSKYILVLVMQGFLSFSLAIEHYHQRWKQIM